MRNYDPSTDRHLLVECVRKPSCRWIGPTLVDMAAMFKREGLVWPKLNQTNGSGDDLRDEYAKLVDNEICNAWDAQKWMVTRDGKPCVTTGTWNQCWEAIHKQSSGNSVEWLMRYEGWSIDPVVEGDAS